MKVGKVLISVHQSNQYIGVLGSRNSDSSRILPRNVDVIFGRGRPYQNHPGNKALNAIVKHYKSFYQQAERGAKAQILNSIVSMLKGDRNNEKDGSIRFLKRANTEENQCIYSGQWTEATDQEILDKVSHILREKPRRTCRSSSSVSKETKVAKGLQQGNQKIVAATNTVNGGAPTSRRGCHKNDGKLHDCKTSSREQTDSDPHDETSNAHPLSSTSKNSFNGNNDEFHDDDDCLYRYFCDFHLCGPGPPPSPSIFDDDGDTTDPPEKSNPNFIANRTA